MIKVFAENYKNLEIIGAIDFEKFDNNKVKKKYSKFGPLNYIVGADHLLPIQIMSEALNLKDPLMICREAINVFTKSIAA
ncbi:hypothetical protein EBS02_10380 [bacterium]|nr:hypothetical protein [bacterium]